MQKFSPVWLSKCFIPNLRVQVNSICRAPLKPDQVLQNFKYYLILRYIHSLQSPQIHQQTLRSADTAIRWGVKRALHLPNYNFKEDGKARGNFSSAGRGGEGIHSMAQQNTKTDKTTQRHHSHECRHQGRRTPPFILWHGVRCT